MWRPRRALPHDSPLRVFGSWAEFGMGRGKVYSLGFKGDRVQEERGLGFRGFPATWRACKEV